ncbi:MAG: iron-containing redox enzyme family protein [Nitrospirae bacterium]|nr:iron-containing redox enzyme family protein [Nitrospirota bacterium]
MSRPMLPSTRAYIEGMERLYADGNHEIALGASFGLENMAIPMWDHLIPGLRILRGLRYPAMDLTYFTFHRDLESSHEDAMAHAVAVLESGQTAGQAGLSVRARVDFRRGSEAVLDYLRGFWKGLDQSSNKPRSYSAA